MHTGIQFTGTLGPNTSARWYTFNWPATEYVVWTVVPDSINPSGQEITWSVNVQRASSTYVTYWINITNLTGTAVDIEARYAIF